MRGKQAAVINGLQYCHSSIQVYPSFRLSHKSATGDEHITDKHNLANITAELYQSNVSLWHPLTVDKDNDDHGQNEEACLPVISVDLREGSGDGEEHNHENHRHKESQPLWEPVNQKKGR